MHKRVLPSIAPSGHRASRRLYAAVGTSSSFVTTTRLMQATLLHHTTPPVRRGSAWRRGIAARLSHSAAATPSVFARRTVFVRFQPTPNDACFKFYVDDVRFLPPHSRTMMFDGGNSYQSPLAHALLESLPMVEEVTVGETFITVRRVEEADAEAAARLFAMKFHGVQTAHETDEEAAAVRSQALQQQVEKARGEGADAASARDRSSSTQPASGLEAEAPIEMGGFTVSPSAQDEQINEAALQALIAATDWSELKLHVSALITDHLSSGNPHVDPTAPHPHADTIPEDGDSEVVLMLKELIATTIRPQLQEDGGDLRFIAFGASSGEMHVELLGACRTCKSSKTTLVDLIERTTRHWIPEVKAVRDVSRVLSASQRLATSHTGEGEANTEASAEGGAAASSAHDETDDDAQSNVDDLSNAGKTVQFSSRSTADAGDNRDAAAPTAYRILRDIRNSRGEQKEPSRAPDATTAVAASTQH